MVKKYKLINSEETKGVWVNEIELINLIKVCKNRNITMYNKLIEWYEYLEGKSFDYNLIDNKGKYM